LPKAIQSVLATSYEGWELVTADLLSPDLRKMWKKEMAGACPDFVGGRFTGPAEEYTVNLIKRVDGKVCEQVLLFKPVTASFAKISILPPIEVATVSVITRTPPGSTRTRKKLTV
jgi:hypothetical protein